MCSALARACARISAAPQGGDLLLRRPTIHWVVVTHPTEFVRATSTAKIAARTLCGGATRDTCEWLLFGCKAHTHRLDELLTGNEGAVHILFPRKEHCDEGGTSAAEAFAAFSATASESKGKDEPAVKQWVVIVPDGSWECAKALVAEIQRRAGRSIKLLELDRDRVAATTSQLIDALHHGSGCGRISTLEACAQLIEEAGDSERARRVVDAMAPLVQHIVSQDKLENDGAAVAASTASPLHKSWVAAFEALAQDDRHRVAIPAGLRRCGLCRMTLSTHNRMVRHLQGRKHCEAVASKLLSSEAEPCMPTDESAATAWNAYNTKALAHATIEPPDVGIALLTAAMSCGEACAGLHECV